MTVPWSFRAMLSSALVAVLAGCESPSTSEPPAKRVESPGPVAEDARVLRGGPVVPPNLRDVYDLVDEANDEWAVERFHAMAAEQMMRIEELLASDEGPVLDGLIAQDYVGTALRPEGLELVFRDDNLRVHRRSDAPPAVHRGHEGFLASVRALRAAFREDASIETELAIQRATPRETGASTMIRFTAHGPSGEDVLQQNAQWRCQWRASKDGTPLLESIEVTRHEELVCAHGRPLYVECTDSVLGRNASFREQIVPSLNHWRANMDAKLGISVVGHQGIAIGDVNGDDLDDLYSCQPGGLPNRLFVQQEDGTAVDVSSASGTDYQEESRSALLVDLDNDGDQDLALQTISFLLFLENDGHGVFTVRDVRRTPMATSLCAADYDEDGLLDLYVCCYASPYKQKPPVPYHDANNGLPNFLIRNRGDFRFEDVTTRVGLDRNNRRYSFTASWEDYDDDGDVDLYVANDFGRNNLFRNDRGTFADVAPEAGVEDISAGMGVSWRDYDGDGLVDLYVSNMYSSAGGRVAYQPRFQPGADEETRAAYQRHARGNSLFKNDGDGTFTDVSEAAGVTMGRWAWGSIFLDMNNDGREDLFVPNGFITNRDTGDL